MCRLPNLWVLFLILGLASFAAGHFTYFELRSATARIGRALTLRTVAPEVPATQWAPQDTEPSPLPLGNALVRDDGGAIAAVFICFDSTWMTNVAPLFTDLFQKLPTAVQVQIACTSAASIDCFEREWGCDERSRGREVVVMNANRPLTVWARDRHLAAQGPLGKVRISLVPRPKDGASVYVHERAIPKLRLAEGLVDRIGYMPFYLEGGNVASNGRHVFIGNNVVADNGEVLLDAVELCQELGSLFGREVLLVRDFAGEVPHDHIDMYLTVVDQKTVLLADLDAGSKLLELQDGRRPLSAVYSSRTKQRQLNEISKLLSAQGYTVERIPAVMHSQNDWMVTYNNALLERRDGEKVAYIPRYHLPIIDKAAAAVYKKLGFRVETIDVSKVFQGRGALRCVVNVTLRKPLDPPASR